MGKIGQISTNNIVSTKPENEPGFFAAASELLSDFPERVQEIIKKRFGLSEEDPQTLEKIGQDYGITRERVRQIVVDAVKKISTKKEEAIFEKSHEQIVFTIDSNNGIIKETEIIGRLGLGGKKEASSVEFFRVCSKRILVYLDSEIEKSWILDKKVIEKAKAAIMVAKEILKKEKKPLLEEEFVGKIREIEKGIAKEEISNFINVASGIKKNNFGKWGLVQWAEINPKGTRERIYAVLREKKKPLHFSEITKLIDEYALSPKKAHLQTVHNELIKHDQFVLIGRGVYALKEWGYSAGTIQDVLKSILIQNGKAMPKKDILKEVSKIRQVKKATILINLSNNKIFTKKDGFYSVRKK